MKKTLKRLLSLIIATFLILSFSIVPAFASSSPPTTWTSTSTAADSTKQTIRANNIYESGVTVTAYQIVKGTYKDDKLTGYVLCDSANAHITNITAPTSTEITTIANNIQRGRANLASVQMLEDPSGSESYKAEVEAGEYIILVTNSNATVYNPAIVAVNVGDANNIDTSSSGDNVSMISQFSFGPTAYMKSASVMVEKTISGARYVNSASFGSTVGFQTYATVPSYSQDYETVQFVITDDLYLDRLDRSVNPPFLGVNGLTVKVDGSEVPQVTGEGAEAVTNYEIKYYKKNESTTGDPIVTTQDPSEAVYYEIEFADAYIRANGGKGIYVNYSTTLTNNAKLALQDYSGNFVSNDTRATVLYSNDPTYIPPEDDSGNQAPYNEKSASTKTYTFGIDSGNSGGIQTYELNKVIQAGGTYTSVLDNNDQEITKKSPYALAGATFTIYSDRAMTQDQDHIIGTATSDANGHIEFRGLGAGTYYLKETAAPSNYTLNENNYKIVVSASLNQSSVNSTLNSYSITTYLMGETDTQIGSAEYTQSGNTITPAEVVNTQLATLPTTGGVGTIVISVIAGLGMAIFLTVFVISKKRSSKKN